ncbi:MAG: Hsp70 family protein [Acidobacteria bacterium]|nr:Hsp70 family protein [Acidobacteriota bacterium]
MPETSGHRLEAMIGVPANANSNQRFLTAEAFRLAGFDVLGVLNEPSAASIEFGHRNKKDAQKKKLLLVYDLGGGTFDASLVEHDEQTHTVLASDGITTLGGDDFDYVLAELALSAAGLSKGKITDSELFRLLEECRRKKESLHPNTRKLAVDLDCVREGWPEISLPVAQFYEEARPYVEETIDTVRGLLDRQGHAAPDCLYITGGGSELPLVARRLKEEFGRRVKRSAYTRSATAIGLAIQADAASGYELRDKFTRYFGVWREAEAGRRIIFDPLFEKGAPLPGTGERALEITRRYRPVHNIGHLRYLECSHVAGDQPGGDITFWDEIRFALDPALHRHASVEGLPVEYSQRAAEQDIEEVYRCDAAGIVHVTIRNLSAGYEQTWHLGRWSVRTKPVTLARKRRAAAHSIES